MVARPLGNLSKLDIINDALMLARLPSISTLDDSSDVFSRMYADIYESTLAGLLMNTPVTFSKKTAQLNQSIEKTGWYVLPSDFLSILPPHKIYQRDGNYVKTSGSTIEYIKYLDAKLFPPLFTSLVTMTLASIYAQFRDNPQLGMLLNSSAKVLLSSFNDSMASIPEVRE